jgi:hypothetical protein
VYLVFGPGDGFDQSIQPDRALTISRSAALAMGCSFGLSSAGIALRTCCSRVASSPLRWVKSFAAIAIINAIIALVVWSLLASLDRERRRQRQRQLQWCDCRTYCQRLGLAVCRWQHCPLRHAETCSRSWISTWKSEPCNFLIGSPKRRR